MDKLSKQEKAEARQLFENQLRYAFIKYDYVDDEEDNTEATVDGGVGSGRLCRKYLEQIRASWNVMKVEETRRVCHDLSGDP
ncbi:unnamed protein product [Pieris macdunnoughi]|uniref:Uncharacterized protein n=1 Tax=Pieris macdunnoughi TaxID=345717 RepID=A0A821LCX2_9NEOP|nr:unnamed protein product [Pieris macdunnoughi]